MFPVSFTEKSRDGSARSGVALTHRGTYTTPCFMPVGTRGTIKYLSAQDYEEIGAQIILGNTYHLMLRPGA
ncbi:MAG: tRNA-guanine transglycosylase, partial [Ilumatobacteraceae bacterium]